MHEMDLKKVDPRLVARAAEYVGAGFAQMSQSPVPPGIIPGRGPVSMPVAMPARPARGDTPAIAR